MIPERYKKQGFNKVGQKKQSTRPGKKWMVLAKKGDSYKIVHGGDDSMQDYTQHHSEQRRKNFWNRMGGKNSSKATDPFSPLYWHKRFGTWAIGGKNTAEGQQTAFNQYMLGMLKDSEEGEDFNPYVINPDSTFEVSDEVKNKLKKNRQEISPIRKYGENLQYDIKTGTGQYDFSPEFEGFNALAQITTGIANMSNDAKARRYENNQYLKALTPQPKYNYNEAGLNNIPLYGNGGKTKHNAIEQAFIDAYNNYNNRVFPKETLETRQKAYRTINPSDYTDLRNYGRWVADEQRDEFYDPRSEEAFKFYLGLNRPEELQYLKKSKYKPTINATDQNYYSLDSDLEQDIFNSYKDKVKLNETLQTNEAEFQTPLSGKGAAGVLGRFGVSRGHDENGDYLSYYDKYDLKDFAQSRTKGMPYSIYNRIYYPKKQEGGKVVNPNNPVQLPNVNFVFKRPVAKSTFNPYANVNRVGTSDNTKVFKLNPEQVENAKKAAAIRNEKIIKEYLQNQQSFIGPDNRTKAERDKSIAARKAYDELVEKQKVMSQQPFYQTLQSTTAGGYNPNAAYNPVIGNTSEALGYMAAGALGSSVARPAFNFMGEAMNAPIQGIPGLTGNNIVNAGFATHGLKSIMDGSVAKPWKEARRTGNPWDYVNAVNENLMTAMELAPLVGPGYRGALEAGNVYNNIATGNSIIPRAWKSPAVGLSQNASDVMFKGLLNSNKLTDAERALLVEYQYNSKPFTGRGILGVNQEKKEALNNIIKKYNLNFNNNSILTRRFNPENQSLGADFVNGNLNLKDRPSSFSAGVGISGFGSGAVDRLVIPNRYAKKMGNNFLANEYGALSDDAINLVDPKVKNFASLIGPGNPSLSAEREVIGTGLNFKRIGKVKNDIGGYDHIVKPTNAKKVPIKKQEGGEVEKTEPIVNEVDPETYTKNQYERSKDFHTKWMTSPMYNKMLKASDPANAEKINKIRFDNLNSTRFVYEPIQPEDMINVGGDSDIEGVVNIYPRGYNDNVSLLGTHEMSHSIDRPSVLFSGSEPDRVIPYEDVYRIDDYANVNRYNPKSLEDELYHKEFLDRYDNIAKPTETRARLNEIRDNAYQNKIYNPFTQKVNKKIFKKLTNFKFEKNPNWSPMDDLKSVYTDKQIINLLNTVSKKTNTDTNPQMMDDSNDWEIIA